MIVKKFQEVPNRKGFVCGSGKEYRYDSGFYRHNFQWKCELVWCIIHRNEKMHVEVLIVLIDGSLKNNSKSGKNVALNEGNEW